MMPITIPVQNIGISLIQLSFQTFCFPLCWHLLTLKFPFSQTGQWDCAYSSWIKSPIIWVTRPRSSVCKILTTPAIASTLKRDDPKKELIRNVLWEDTSWVSMIIRRVCLSPVPSFISITIYKQGVRMQHLSKQTEQEFKVCQPFPRLCFVYKMYKNIPALPYWSYKCFAWISLPIFPTMGSICTKKSTLSGMSVH